MSFSLICVTHFLHWKSLLSHPLINEENTENKHKINKYSKLNIYNTIFKIPLTSIVRIYIYTSIYKSNVKLFLSQKPKNKYIKLYFKFSVLFKDESRVKY